jgi:hypothetical protein
MIIGEQPVFQRKLNKKRKPVGKPVLTGFTFDFNAPVLAASAMSRGDFVVDTVTTKKVKKVVKRVLHPIANFTVSFLASGEDIELTLTGKQTFPKGGQITIQPELTSVTFGQMTGPMDFTIGKGGKSITPS